MVSICIPAYENTLQLRLLLDTIGRQTYTNYEIILSDDSSSDQVEQLVKDHVLAPKIRYQRNVPAKGSPGNWNYCISLAQGAYLKIMHHDDVFAASDSLAKMVQSLEQQPDMDLVYSRCTVLKENGAQHVHSSNAASFRYLKQQPYYLFERNMIGPPSCILYRRSNALHFDESLKWLVDIDFYIRYFESKTCGFIDEVLISTHTHEQSVTNALNADFKLQEELQYLDRHYARIPEVIRCRWLLQHEAALSRMDLKPLNPRLRRKIGRMRAFSAIFAFYYKVINYRFWHSTERYFFEATL